MEGYAYGNRNPTLQQGIISGKVLVDIDLVDEFKTNDMLPSTRDQSYPNGQNELAHNIMPGDMIIGRRKMRTGDRAESGTDFMEVGVAAVNGHSYEYKHSQAEVESEFYWVGHATTEQRALNPNDPSMPDANNQASGTVKAGVLTVPWNSYTEGFAGDKVYWHLPRIEKFFGSASDQTDTTTVYIPGTEPSQARPMYGTLDSVCFQQHLAAAMAAMQIPKSDGGISDMPYHETLPQYTARGEDSKWSPIQQTAIALRYGVWGQALTLIEHLVTNGKITILGGGDTAQLADDIGLWRPEAQQPSTALSGLAAVFFPHMMPFDLLTDTARTDFTRGGQEYYATANTAPQVEAQMGPDAQQALYRHLRTKHTDLLFDGIAEACEAKNEKCVGMLLNHVCKGEDADIIFGMHTK